MALDLDVVSTFYDGEQMIKPFNKLQIDVSCLGNHELDLGLPKAEELIAKTNCPWVISNLYEVARNMEPCCGLP